MSPGAIFACSAVVVLPALLVAAAWLFLRSGVRSGVRQAAPPQAPVASLTEAAVREIVRDEIRRLQAARRSGEPSQASPR